MPRATSCALFNSTVLGEDDLSVGCRFQQIRVEAREGGLQTLDELLTRRELRRP